MGLLNAVRRGAAGASRPGSGKARRRRSIRKTSVRRCRNPGNSTISGAAGWRRLRPCRRISAKSGSERCATGPARGVPTQLRNSRRRPDLRLSDAAGRGRARFRRWYRCRGPGREPGRIRTRRTRASRCSAAMCSRMRRPRSARKTNGATRRSTGRGCIFTGARSRRSTACCVPRCSGISRAADWLAEQPFADADRIGVFGSSQGGGFALMLAGLKPRFRAAAANVPAFCDFGGEKSGWPQFRSTASTG